MSEEKTVDGFEIWKCEIVHPGLAGTKYEKDCGLGFIVHRNVDMIRARSGMKLEDLVAKLGLKSEGNLYYIFRKTSQPTMEDLELLAEALDVEVIDLIRY